MKRLACEMCGATDVVKVDGLFVCQYCGTKYSVEEARRMMIEGTVEVTGRVKVDNSEKLENLYQIARRAKDDNNGENAAKYYDMILVEDPTSWEAAFYVVYFKAMECKIAQIHSAIVSVNNCIDTVLKLIKDKVVNEDERERAIKEVSNHVLIISTMMARASKNHYEEIGVEIKSSFLQGYVDSTFACFNTMYNMGNQLECVFGDLRFACDMAVVAWTAGIDWHSGIIGMLDDKESNKNTMLRYAEKIKKYNASYLPPKVSTGGCYIATAIYGSYECPQLWTLRRYRDCILAKTWHGRAIIRIYYAISPTFAKRFSHTVWLKTICKNKLDHMVKMLQSEGISEIPYEDEIP